MIKKLLILLSVFVFVFSVFQEQTFALENSDFGYEVYGDNVTITFFKGEYSDVIIPEEINGKKVTGITSEVFANNDIIKTVFIPGTIKSIGTDVFYNCKNLKSVTFDDGTESLYYNAFRDCLSLAEINIPKSLTYISSNAFNNCPSLIDIEIDMDNTTLKSVDNVIYKGNVLVLYPGGKTSQVFEIANDITMIEDGAFNNNHYIKEVIIPNSVSTISAYNFINCSNLEKISLTERKDDYYSVDGIVYNGNSVVFYPSGKKNESYELPDNITQLSDSSFSYNYYLKNITLPEELTTIGMYAFNQCYKLEEINIPKNVSLIGDNYGTPGFEKCYSLKSINVDNDNNVYYSLDGVLCTGESILTYPMNKEDIIYNIPDLITRIGTEAFAHNQNLQKVIMHNNVTSISSYAFYNCENLIEADLPDKLMFLNEHVFTNSGIKKVVLPRSIIELNLFENASTGITYYVYRDKIDWVESLSLNYETITEMYDQQTNIMLDSWLCNNITKNSVLKTSRVIDGVDYQKINEILDEFEMYEVELYDENSQELSINDRCKLSIPLTDGNEFYNVYYYEDNRLIPIDSVIDNGYITFKTNKMGKFIVTNLEINMSIGDINNDGLIGYADAVLILQSDSKILELTELQKSVADVNRDGIISYSDAVLILRKDAGLITEF